MPIRVHVVDPDSVHDTVKRYMGRGYDCRVDDDGDWECVKPINEILMDVHLLVLKPKK
jgi:hypothetical protein